jgi:hypothetical protein
LKVSYQTIRSRNRFCDSEEAGAERSAPFWTTCFLMAAKCPGNIRINNELATRIQNSGLRICGSESLRHIQGSGTQFSYVQCFRSRLNLDPMWNCNTGPSRKYMSSHFTAIVQIGSKVYLKSVCVQEIQYSFYHIYILGGFLICLVLGVKSRRQLEHFNIKMFQKEDSLCRYPTRQHSV